MQAGFHTLIKANSDAIIDSGQWKVFPHLHMRKYKQLNQRGLDPIRVWYKDIQKYDRPESRFSCKLRNFLRCLGSTRVFAPLNSWSEKLTGLDFYSAGETRWFRRKPINKLLKQLFLADLVIFNCGGLLADHLGHYLPGRLFELYLAKKLGRVVIAANHTVSLTKPGHIQLAGPILSELDFHLVREPFSERALQSMGVASSKIRVTEDAAFAAPNIPTLPKRRIREGIGFMIRGDRKVNFDIWTELLSRAKQKFDANVFYLQGCRKHDARVYRHLAKGVDLANDKSFIEYPDLIEAISELRLLLTDRYHGMVFAMLAGTPYLPVQSTTHKTEGFLELHAPNCKVLGALDKRNIDEYLHRIEGALFAPNNSSCSMEITAIVKKLHSDYQKVLNYFGVGV